MTDPTTFFKDYEVPMREETLGDLEFSDLKFAQVFVICNKIGDWLTGNLLGPIIVNSESRIAQQVVLTEKKWTTRQPLLRLAVKCPWPSRHKRPRFDRPRTKDWGSNGPGTGMFRVARHAAAAITAVAA